jgi:hypothetical protein
MHPGAFLPSGSRRQTCWLRAVKRNEKSILTSFLFMKLGGLAGELIIGPFRQHQYFF